MATWRLGRELANLLLCLRRPEFRANTCRTLQVRPPSQGHAFSVRAFVEAPD